MFSVKVCNEGQRPMRSLLKGLNSNFFYCIQSPMNKRIESQKAVAERVNGWAAMMGFWAVVGAYLTTGQIIPGLV